VLDFLSATDVGRLVPMGRRIRRVRRRSRSSGSGEREEERKVEAEELGAEDGELPLFFPAPPFMAPAEGSRTGGAAFFCLFFPFSFSLCLSL
jgi:hypothetical protein